MSGAHCAKFPICPNFNEKAVPVCDKPDCPGTASRKAFAAMFAPPPKELIVAQALFDRTCERAQARGHEPHHRPGTRVEDMPPSYKDDYLADARAAIEAYERGGHRAE